MASAATNTAPPACEAGTSLGRSKSDTHSPSPAGDCHERARRPRPAVCSAAVTAHSPSPASASFLAAALVESTDG